MHVTSTLALRGIPKIWLVYPDGTRKLHWHEENQIVLSARQAFMSMLYLSNQTSDPITRLWIGTGGTIDPEGQFPKPVPPNATGLFTPLTSVSTSYTVDNSMPSVTFVADIDQSTANGVLINEAGLFKNSNLIFNLKTFPGIPKASGFGVHFEWDIELA